MNNHENYIAQKTIKVYTDIIKDLKKENEKLKEENLKLRETISGVSSIKRGPIE